MILVFSAMIYFYIGICFYLYKRKVTNKEIVYAGLFLKGRINMFMVKGGTFYLPSGVYNYRWERCDYGMYFGKEKPTYLSDGKIIAEFIGE